MALEPTPDPLDRATRAARRNEPEGWIELSASIMSRVGSLVVASPPILTFTEEGNSTRDAEGSRTYFAARIVTSALRRLLQRDPTHAPDDIRLVVENDELTSVEISVVCAYGVDLIAVAEAIRRDVWAELEQLVGPGAQDQPVTVSVAITDVVEGDPNRV